MKKLPIVLASVCLCTAAIIVARGHFESPRDTGNPAAAPPRPAAEPAPSSAARPHPTPVPSARESLAGAPDQADGPENNADAGVSPSTPQTDARTILAALRPEMDAALLASDFTGADRIVDKAVAASGVGGEQKQRVLAAKMATRGMRGDHAGMLALLDEIVAIQPDSPFAAEMLENRPELEKLAAGGRNPPHFCETCRSPHRPGEHKQAGSGQAPAGNE